MGVVKALGTEVRAVPEVAVAKGMQALCMEYGSGQDLCKDKRSCYSNNLWEKLLVEALADLPLTRRAQERTGPGRRHHQTGLRAEDQGAQRGEGEARDGLAQTQRKWQAQQPRASGPTACARPSLLGALIIRSLGGCVAARPHRDRLRRTFHTLWPHGDEWPLCVFESDGVYHGHLRLPFGLASAPLSWGRLVAAISASCSQGLGRQSARSITTWATPAPYWPPRLRGAGSVPWRGTFAPPVPCVGIC